MNTQLNWQWFPDQKAWRADSLANIKINIVSDAMGCELFAVMPDGRLWIGAFEDNTVPLEEFKAHGQALHDQLCLLRDTAANFGRQAQKKLTELAEKEAKLNESPLILPPHLRKRS